MSYSTMEASSSSTMIDLSYVFPKKGDDTRRYTLTNCNKDCLTVVLVVNVRMIFPSLPYTSATARMSKHHFNAELLLTYYIYILFSYSACRCVPGSSEQDLLLG